jgi:hypothetical protein
VLLVAGALAATGAIFGSALSGAAVVPQPGQRVDLRMLVLANDAADGNSLAWQDNLRREGVPFDVITGATTLTAATFADGDHAKYQGVIVSAPDGTAGGVPAQFSAAEFDLLHAFEAKFSIRQLDVNAFPGPPLGLNFAGSTGTMDGQTGSLTTAGLAQFTSLKGPVPFQDLSPTVSETFGASATPCDGVAVAACNATSFETLLQGPSGGSLVGIAQTKDAREEMVSTVSANQFQLHNGLLRHGMLSWVTGGVYIGLDRSYLSMDVDDIFLPDDQWNAATNFTVENGALTPGKGPQQDLRMTAADVSRLVNFQNANGVKLNMLFNANGINDAAGVTATTVSPASIVADPLATAMLAQKNQFNWINHTWSHPSLGSPNPDVPSQATIQQQISQNVAFADANGLSTANPAGQGSFNRSELVTGEHSGIGVSKATALGPVAPPTPAMAAALNAEGVTSVGADNSREIGQRQVGNAYTLPRYPMNVFYNVSTWADQLDEYDWIYLDKNAAFVDPPAGGVSGIPGTPSATVPPRGNCTPPAQGGAYDCFTTPVTQAQFVQRESAALLGTMLANDPRPHYAHQTNLISDPNALLVANRGDGILYAVLSAALTGYRAYRTTTVQQPGMTALRDVLRRQIAWDATTSAQVNGYIQDGIVTIVSTVARDVPITGTTSGDLYGGQRSGWLATAPGTTTLTPNDPHNAAAPVISGATTTAGSTLTTTDGSWTGTPTVSHTRQWQRRANAAAPWTAIAGATSPTYTITAADLGQSLRTVISARNRVSKWSLALSAPVTAGIVQPPPIVPPATTPAPPAPAAGPKPPPAGGAPPAGVGQPAGTAPLAGTAQPTTGSAVARAAFTCKVKRGKRVSVACTVTDTSVRMKTASITAMRATKLLGRASGPVRRGNQVPVLRLKRTPERRATRITITVRLANGKLRRMTRTLRI